ncbi:MAG: alpha-glucan family phosphorylase, partial [Actinobacteria bacterium]|nr:alpha-glucan family phosphorylase [Actinomycetota bacterium]
MTAIDPATSDVPVKALRSFTVRPRLPEPLEALDRLSSNLRWSWDRPTRELFTSIDPRIWDEGGHDPRRVLAEVAPGRLDELASDASFIERMTSVAAALDVYGSLPRWFQQELATGHVPTVGGESALDGGVVAYFSPEFGIAEAVPQYSGGLGVLAGDHLKAASDLGVPLVAIGLFYRHGYFRQSLTVDGWQQERFPDLDPYAMALELCDGVRVEVDLAERPLVAQVWKASIGRTPLYLLDADVEENPQDLQLVTDRLYGGDVEHRLRQEILLGIGGVRALEALGVPAHVFHTNEGHAGFLGLERIRTHMHRDGLSFPEALEAVRAGAVFTTHTPVPAGIDQFPRELMQRYFGGWANECGIDLDTLMALGHHPQDPPDERFNMAVMGMHLAERRNGVSELHGEVSRGMFCDLWPGVPRAETPIGHITNGVHGSTWVSGEMAEIFSDHVGSDWQWAGPDRWDAISGTDDDVLWQAHRSAKVRMVEHVRERLRASGLSVGRSASELAWVDDALDPDALTICFARRFATYKRAALLLSQSERLRALLGDADRPIQFVFAGKAHPADDSGKELIRQIVAFSQDPEVRTRFMFVEDYDMALARALVQGADIWLNTPVRPMEASGTSGMKAVMNGAMHCSVLDGWWAECFRAGAPESDEPGGSERTNGWAISSAESVEDPERRAELEANSLFDILESQVVPLYHATSSNQASTPHAWVARVKESLRTLGPFVSAHRMVREYVEGLYLPSAQRAALLCADGHRGARELAAFRARVAEHWHLVHIDDVDVDDAIADLGGSRPVSATVALGELRPDEVEVQLV